MNTLKLFSLSAVVLLASACGEPGVVQGKISDNDGAQARILGGAGTIAAAATAQLSIVNDDGSLQVIGEAAVSADGAYSIESETVGEAKLVVQALDAGGAVVGSVILDQGLAEGETETASPITSETSLEAEVFIEMAASAELTVDDIDTCDIKARIDASTAAAANLSANVEAEIAALAQATASAQAAFFTSLETNAEATFNASLAASVALSEELDAQFDNAQQSSASYQAYLAGLVSAYADAGFEEADQADAQVVASASFQLTLDAQAEASAEVVAQASLQAQAYQAIALTVTSDAILSAAGAADASIQAIVAAGEQLSSDIGAAADIGASANAYLDFEASVVSGDNSALDVAAGVDVGGALFLQQAVIDGALGTFDAALDAAANVNAQATAQAVINAYAALDATLSATVSTALIASGQATADACASIFISTEASVLLSN